MGTREQIIVLILKGESNETISKTTGITISGVKYHISKLLSEFSVKNRSQLIIAIQNKMPESLNNRNAASQDVCPVVNSRKL